MNCLYCGKETNRPKFCCNKHKDKYHNIHNPRGFYAPVTHDNIESIGHKIDPIEDSMHPQDPDALGQE